MTVVLRLLVITWKPRREGMRNGNYGKLLILTHPWHLCKSCRLDVNISSGLLPSTRQVGVKQAIHLAIRKQERKIVSNIYVDIKSNSAKLISFKD